MIIEALTRQYLTNEGFTAYVEEPENPPDTYLLIDKTGSSLENHINQSTIAIQSYSTSKYATAVLNEQVKEAMLNIVTLPDIGACRLNSDYNFTDPQTKRYRYQAVFSITHY